MGIKNHNTKREKTVMRKRLRIAVFIAVSLGIVLIVFRYFGFVSKTIYEESVSHLTEVFHQSDNMLRELTDKNLNYLHMWGENLQDISSEDEIQDYIKKAQEDTGFLDFFFLSADGNYKMATGETGYLGLQENIEDEIRQGNDVIANAAVPGKSQLLVFATAKAHGIYQGFEYDAIAIAYENSDIVDVLDISAFDGNAQSFVVHPDGRVVVDHSSEAWGNVYNFFGVLREHSDMSEKEINELSEKFKARRTDAMLLNLDGRNYYLVYEKSDIQDWMFLGLVQADIVNASMNSLQRSTILLVGAVVLCIAALLISFIIQKGRINLRKKDTEILYRDIDHRCRVPGIVIISSAISWEASSGSRVFGTDRFFHHRKFNSASPAHCMTASDALERTKFASPLHDRFRCSGTDEIRTDQADLRQTAILWQDGT